MSGGAGYQHTALGMESVLASRWSRSLLNFGIQSTTQSRFAVLLNSLLRQRSVATRQIPDTLPRAAEMSSPAEKKVDVLVIGAGPTGLACAIEAQRAGFSVLVVDKGCLVNSIFHYPANMTFFTTPELLEIGDHPFQHGPPEAYPRRGAGVLPQGRRTLPPARCAIPAGGNGGGDDGEFHVTATDELGRIYDYETRKLIVSTGYYDLANQLGVPGEDLPKVFHYYREPHPFFDCDVVVVGGKNSAAISALDLWRHGSRVTLVHRGPKMHHHVKYWILPDIENRVKNGEIKAYFNSSLQLIEPESVVLDTTEGPVSLKMTSCLPSLVITPTMTFCGRWGSSYLPSNAVRCAIRKRSKAMSRASTWRA